jgi:RNA polymerase sigma-70 factor (ECF subfamily)
MNVNAEIKLTHQHASSFNEDVCVRGCVQQKMQYQQELYTHFYAVMMAAILRYTSDRDEAASILNNGFLRVFNKIHTFKQAGSLEGWIRRIIIHSVSDYFRYKKPLETVLPETLPESANTSLTIESRHDFNILLNILNELPQTTRIVTNLFIIDSYTHKEIAQMLGISENTSKWHVANGRKILQDKLVSYNEK